MLLPGVSDRRAGHGDVLFVQALILTLPCLVLWIYIRFYLAF